MSSFLGLSSSPFQRTVTTAAEAARKQQTREIQKQALYELGLLSDNKTRPGSSQLRDRPKDKGKDPKKGRPGPQDSQDGHMFKDSLRGTLSSRKNPSVTSQQSSSTKGSSDLRNRAGGGMAGMLGDADRSRTRRERTFVGSECAVCEEPLEHTLRGERILQFSCGHVSHEACFYEYIKEFDSQYCPTCNAPLGLDTSRGGNVLDIEKLSSIVRSVAASDQSMRSQQTPTPTPWDSQTVRPHSRESNSRQQSVRGGRDNSRDTRDSNGGSSRDSRDSRERAEMYKSQQRSTHTRNDSEATGAASSVGYPETTTSGPPRRHDYDVQSMESSLASPRASVSRNPIPPPSVSVRSEFPTLNRSRQQQTLTCLVTIEIPDNKWRPDPDDLRSAPPVPTVRPEETYARPPSPAQSAPRFYPYESPEVLDEITESLRQRVENWHGLDFTR